MTNQHPSILGLGLTGKSLTELERRILTDTPPYAIILFGRNVGTVEQLRDLVHEVKRTAKRPPLIMIDEEGGRVDRLRNIVPGFPSAEAFGEGERSEEMAGWLGKSIGMALRFFGIDVNLAPVVDVRGSEPPKGLERRTFGADPETVVQLAGAFVRGSHEAGVATCLKHFPGIGLGSADPHYGATVIDIPLEALMQRDLVPYARLGAEAGAVMVGHGTYPRLDDPDLPATLSWRLTTDLLRNGVGFGGIAISDDMEMHAVSDLGSYEWITERALMAGNDTVMFCSHIERIPDLESHLDARLVADPGLKARYDVALARCDAYRAHCERLQAAAPRAESFDEVLDEVVRFCEAFEEAQPARETVSPDNDRRRGSRVPGKGRTGREEWT